MDVFSLNSINQQLPAHPKAVVPLAQAELDSEDKLTIPYSYQTNRIAATSSRNYVFYASSPNADVLNPYLLYCATKGRSDNPNLPKFGLLFQSSYSLLRVYRVSAYRRCGAYSCGQDLIKFVTFDGFSRKLNRECDETFNVSVAALEYLNEDNIAVTLLSSPVTGWDGVSETFPGAARTTYWLNPATMRVRRTVWQTDPASSGIPTQIPSLCPALQRVPRVGTFLAEALNAGVFLLRFAVGLVAYTPGLIPVWSSPGGVRCPAPGSALYHSELANCGERVYALDDFFDSLDDAGAVFWHSLSLLARLIAPSGMPALAQPITNVLDGMSQYGQGAVDVWAGGSAVLSLTKVPIKDQVTQVCSPTPCRPNTIESADLPPKRRCGPWSRRARRATGRAWSRRWRAPGRARWPGAGSPTRCSPPWRWTCSSGSWTRCGMSRCPGRSRSSGRTCTTCGRSSRPR